MFSDSRFWWKMKKYAKKIGRPGVEHALMLYYAARAPATPPKIKMLIYTALAYLILPIDALPDYFPGGFVDDIGVLAGAAVAAEAHITPEIEEKAKKKANEWFGGRRRMKGTTYENMRENIRQHCKNYCWWVLLGIILLFGMCGICAGDTTIELRLSGGSLLGFPVLEFYPFILFLSQSYRRDP